MDILGSLPIAIAVVRATDLELLYTNSACQHLVTNEELARITQSIEKSTTFADIETAFETSGLSRRWLRLAGQPTTFDDQSVIILYIQDISAEKQSMQERQRFQALVDQVSDYTFEYQIEDNGNLRPVWFSGSYKSFLGFDATQRDFLNHLATLLYPNDLSIAFQQREDALYQIASVNEFRIITAHGDIRWIRSYLQPVGNRIYGMAQDITFRKKAEEALLLGTAQDIASRQDTEQRLRSYAAELEAINEELDAYSHTIAHDLKVPITSIIGFLDLLDYTLDIDPARAKSYIDHIRRSSQKSIEMIRQLLYMARLRNAEEHIELINVNAIIEEVCARFESQIAEQNIEIIIEAPLLAGMGHAPWLEEVFANLIGNAIKYMGDDNQNPQIIIRSQADEKWIYYEIIDNGVGIKEEDQNKLFELFSRVNMIKREGFGLGLSIVHRIITKLGGQVGVKSELGHGSTFWFSLQAEENA